MKFDNENYYTTYLFVITTISIIIKMTFLDSNHNDIAVTAYGIITCGFFFIYQFIKLSALKKELALSDKKLLKKITKDGSTTINVISIFNNAELFQKSKNMNIYHKFELAKSAVLFSFYSTIALITLIYIYSPFS